MPPAFHLQKPYALAQLPKSLDQSGCSYAVQEVYGQEAGSKKRKRQEVAVGIDGEAVNLYHISESRLITSYPIPPPASFTCAPYSIRCRTKGTQDAVRYTYISTKEPSRKLTLFKDGITTSGGASSTTISKPLDLNKDVVSLSSIGSQASETSTVAAARPVSDLLAATRDGDLLCLDGETLERKWHAPLRSLSPELSSSQDSCRIELVQTGLASEIIAGFSIGDDSSLAVFPSEVEEGRFNPDVIVIVSSSAGIRRAHVMLMPSGTGSEEKQRKTPVQVHCAQLPSHQGNSSASSFYRLDLAAGSLVELRGEDIFSYSLGGSVPYLESTLHVPGAVSILRLSKSSILVSTSTSLEVYNPVLQSLQASVPLELSEPRKSVVGEEQAGQSCSLVVYFSRLDSVVALSAASLVAIKLEPPKTRSRKRHAEGLLIDSIGRGMPRSRDAPELPPREFKTSSFTSLIPGSTSKAYWKELEHDMDLVDKMLSDNDIDGFDRFMAAKVGLKAKKQVNGVHKANGKRSQAEDMAVTRIEWNWPNAGSDYPQVDRRWILYAINRMFTWNHDITSSDQAATRLLVIDRLSESTTLEYLVLAGHLSTPNLRSALKDEIQDVEEIDALLATELPKLVADVDPTMGLLLSWLSATGLGTVELLTSIRLIMRSLELVKDPTSLATKLITYPGADDQDVAKAEENGDSGEVVMELDRLEEELQVTESYLGDETGTRATALSVAFGKLGGCPANLTVRDLRRTFSSAEILSLIHVLRMELIKDGWTTRYLDTSMHDEDEDLEPPPDGSIKLLADLLCRCLDSVGQGGWLINDAILSAGTSEHLDSADFLASLKLEVSAALEGVQEAVHLKGVLGEAVAYCEGVQYNQRSFQQSAKHKAITAARARPEKLQTKNAASLQMLPLGLKAPVGPSRHEDIAPTKVTFGGEVVQRKKTEYALLERKKLGPYALQKINV